ncbi:POC1 centriolar protein A, partial [Ceratobasidium sp. 392]
MATRRVLSTTGDVALQLLRLVDASADVFPPLKSAAAGALHIAELVKARLILMARMQNFRSNKEKWRDFGAYVRDATASVVQSLAQIDRSSSDAGGNLEKLRNTLRETAERIESEQKLSRHVRFLRFLGDPEMIAEMRGRIDASIGLFQLSAASTTMINVGKTFDAIIKNGKTLLAIARDTSAIAANTASISLSATLEKLPRAPGASWDPSRGCMQGTRVKLIDDVMEWVNQPIDANGVDQPEGAKVMLLSAVAGAGKSTVAHTIAHICSERKQLGSSFFCDRETDGRNKPDMLFTTIAADLSRLSLALSRSITAAIEDDRSLPSAPLSRQFEELILKPCQTSSITGPVVIVIDALDEAWSDTLVDILRDHASRLPAAFRIFVTSRMRPELGSLLRRAHVIRMELRIDIQANTEDMARYVPSKLQQLARNRGLGSDWPGERLQKGLADRSDGLFLWVATVCDYLYRRNDPTQELEHIVSTANVWATSAEDKMNKLYTKILESFDWTDLSFVAGYHRVMGAAIATKTPLTISAMEQLHQERPLALEFTLQQLSPLLTGMDRSDHVSQPVRVLHQSLCDFLSNSVEFRIVEEECSQKLAVLCLELLNRELNVTTPGTGYVQEDTETRPGIPISVVETISEALRYACFFWQNHINDSILSEAVKQTLGSFLDQKAILWMEVVAVYGRYHGLSRLREPIYDNGTWTQDCRWNYAKASIALCKRLRYEDRREEALEAIKEAVLIYKQPVMDRTLTLTSDLANSLIELSICLSDLGDHDGALAADTEAVELAQQLAAENYTDHTPRLARSLNCLSVDLATVGCYGEALSANEQVVQLRRQQVVDQPSVYTPDLARSLNNLSFRLSDFGRQVEALAATQEAVQLYRQLAADRPNSFTPDLAESLNNLSNRLSDFGRHDEALAVIEEAVQLRQQLAADRPAAFTPDLAMSLNNLSLRLSDFGRHDEALAVIEEAVQLRRQLAADRPAAFTPNLAQSLNNLSLRLADFGRHEEALAAIEEAVQLRRQLAADRPASFTPDLAMSLNNLSLRLSDFGRHNEALAVIEEAVQLRRQLAEDRPAAFTPDLAQSLYNLSCHLDELGRHEEALAPIQEAIGLCRKLAADRPAVFTSDFADSLDNHSYYLSKLGRHKEALPAIREAVSLFRQLAANRPLVFNASLKRSLENYSIYLRKAGHLEEAEVIDAEIA